MSPVTSTTIEGANISYWELWNPAIDAIRLPVVNLGRKIMQIDFHHAVTYVATRLGGLSHEDASIVAHAAQYVDDATTDGALTFTTGERYIRVTSAHKTFDIRDNGDHADNRLVWVPFHFFPGNETPQANCSSEEVFYRRMMCKPDSPIARDMVHDCVLKKDLPFALHRFGIALHTYVDTWAHQQFVGIVCDLNRLKQIHISPDPAYVNTYVYSDLTSGANQLKAFIAGHLPVGHAGALTCPDMPFLKWSFTRENGETVNRDNLSDFVKAANGAFNMARRYVAGDVTLEYIELPSIDLETITRLLKTTLFIEGEQRHVVWLDAIKNGAFSFGAAEVSYVDQGPGSWKMEALGVDPDDEADVSFLFASNFLMSDWKRFHDAVQYHRLFIIHDLLPRVGLCAS
jgi:hypothetical protein